MDPGLNPLGVVPRASKNPLIKEYTLNHIRDPIINLGSKDHKIWAILSLRVGVVHDFPTPRKARWSRHTARLETSGSRYGSFRKLGVPLKGSFKGSYKGFIKGLGFRVSEN